MAATIKDIAVLPTGSQVFVDTNIFYLSYRVKSLTCKRLIQRIQDGEIVAYVNLQVLSDLLHKLMLAEAFQKGYIKGINATQLKDWLTKNRSLSYTLTDYQNHFEQLLTDLKLKVLPMDEILLKDTKKERVDYGLMTGDSLHLGNMKYHHPPLTDLVTFDNDFDHISGLTIWKPMDVV